MGVQVEAKLDDSDLPLFLQFFLSPERWEWKGKCQGKMRHQPLGTWPILGSFPPSKGKAVGSESGESPESLSQLVATHLVCGVKLSVHTF